MLFMPPFGRLRAVSEVERWVRSRTSPRHTNRAVATNPRLFTRAARIQTTAPLRSWL